MCWSPLSKRWTCKVRVGWNCIFGVGGCSCFCSILFIRWGTDIVDWVDSPCVPSVALGSPGWVDAACSAVDFERCCFLSVSEDVCLSVFGQCAQVSTTSKWEHTTFNRPADLPRSLVNHMNMVPNSALHCHWAFCEAFPLQKLLPWLSGPVKTARLLSCKASCSSAFPATSPVFPHISRHGRYRLVEQYIDNGQRRG